MAPIPNLDAKHPLKRVCVVVLKVLFMSIELEK
jgi:hypothetical protein